MADDTMAEIARARTAPAGQFRVLGIDTWAGPGEHWVVGDYPSPEAARAEADGRTAASHDEYVKYCVYDERGTFLHEGRAR